MKEAKTITLTLTDLDHILDIDHFKANRNIPPSRLFIDGLIREMELNGLEWDKSITNIKIKGID